MGVLKDLLNGDTKRAVGSLTTTSSLAALAASTVLGYALGGPAGALIGMASGAILSEILDKLLNFNRAVDSPFPTTKPYTPPRVPDPDPDVMKKGKTLKGDVYDPSTGKTESNEGFTLSPSLERIKKLEFDTNKLLSQTDCAEKITDNAHKNNAFLELDRKYESLFKLEVNFNEYVRLAKAYNEKDRQKLVEAYELLSKEKSRLDGKPYAGNADAETPKLPTPDTDPLTRKQTFPDDYKRGLELVTPQWTQEHVNSLFAKPVVIDEKKTRLANNYQDKINIALFDGGSKGETLFISDPADYTAEREANKLREIWHAMPLVKKIQIVENGLAKEFEAKAKEVDWTALSQTQDNKEFLKTLFRNNFVGGYVGILNGFDGQKVDEYLGPWDSADVAGSMKKDLEQAPPSAELLRPRIQFAIEHAVNDHARDAWKKLEDMLPLIEQRYQSRVATFQLLKDVRAKEAYIDQKLKPYVEKTIEFERKVQRLEQELKHLRTKKTDLSEHIGSLSLPDKPLVIGLGDFTLLGGLSGQVGVPLQKLGVALDSNNTVLTA